MEENLLSTVEQAIERQTKGTENSRKAIVLTTPRLR